MYSTSHPVSTSLNGGGIGGGIMDGSGTINPAALNSTVLPSPTTNAIPQQSPRGVKRSRSPEGYGDAASGDRGDEDESKPRKRGRPPKSKMLESPISSTHQHTPQSMAAPVQTPQMSARPLPQASPSQASPTQASPTKSTPTKGTVIKALPTVRDHTTDQLNEAQDEYIPREFDEAGEKKVTAAGHPLDGREYKCRTFFVPGRADKLFMLATECARVLGYRDSYLLFNKNRSLYKIIATQAEKDNLIQQEILPYSYRSRQIAIVTARSMFRQFGSRLIQNGRRVRDDYWESKARKQGFTEEDAAGEKRPGGAKAREAAAAEASHSHALTALPHGQIIYSNAPGIEGEHGLGGINPATLAPLPMINLAPTDDLRPRDYSNVQRPRHEISGAAYQDRTQPSSAADILNQSAQTADFNKALTQQRANRTSFLDDYWKRPHHPPPTPPDRPGTVEGDNAAAVGQSAQPEQMTSQSASMTAPPQSMASHQQQQPSQMMTPQAYHQQSNAQNPMASPVRSSHPAMRQDSMQHRSPSMSMGSGAGHPQPAGYGYPNQMWPPPQPQPSPLSQHHSMPQYAQHPQQHSPHPQQSPMHPPPQFPQHQSSGSMHGNPMQYPSMTNMNSMGYPGMGRNMYQQPSPSPQQYAHPSTAGQQPGMPGWAPQGAQGWQGQGY